MPPYLIAGSSLESPVLFSSSLFSIEVPETDASQGLLATCELLTLFQDQKKGSSGPQFMAALCIKRNPSMSEKTLLFLVFLLFSGAVLSSSLIEEAPTAYEVLGDYDFPAGILPKGVSGYDLDAETGSFSAFFNATCSFSLEGSYQLRYRSTVKGSISKGKLKALQGVSVKLFFMWVDIIEVSRSGDFLEFSVGIAGAGFPIDNFEESPQCGCGFNCGDRERVINLRTNPFVSSS